ncbi:MAG: 4-hydroxybenzoate octaprenyltransferase [Gammaproteobacteria bacterium]|nr:4-hydroxybenzoate octaprenyltransferase [Gammaproteobacteria bacterium]MYF29897.1 4-hydroxybenzoate octaprenyltransferase [Gammaproteobacteria bacterium]MYK47435.1 4-hydroxybenzoate octaprenyltransferase [Gammaproteobacteria bacterium]
MGVSAAGKIHAIARLMRVDRPVGTLLLLWPTLAALWIAAEGLPPIGILAAFVAGTFLARSAGCVVNDIADRNVDGHIERTRDRPLPKGEVSLGEALALLTILAALCLVVVLTLNIATRWLALAGAGIAAGYPFLKRWTHWPQAALGVAFSWGIPMAFAAVNGETNVIAWLLFGASFLWIIAYDTLYAMVDRDDDLIVGIKSTAVLFGRADRAVIGVLQLATVGVLVGVGVVAGFADGWYFGVAVALGLFVFQQRLIKNRHRDACFRAFRNNVWVGFAVFAGVVAEFGTVGSGHG